MATNAAVPMGQELSCSVTGCHLLMGLISCVLSATRVCHYSVHMAGALHRLFIRCKLLFFLLTTIEPARRHLRPSMALLADLSALARRSGGSGRAGSTINWDVIAPASHV